MQRKGKISRGAGNRTCDRSDSLFIYTLLCSIRKAGLMPSGCAFLAYLLSLSVRWPQNCFSGWSAVGVGKDIALYVTIGEPACSGGILNIVLWKYYIRPGQRPRAGATDTLRRRTVSSTLNSVLRRRWGVRADTATPNSFSQLGMRLVSIRP